MDLDFNFISGDFLYEDLPKNREYLNKYFVNNAEKRFVNYYLIFSKLYRRDEDFVTFYKNFIDHTGNLYSDRWVRKLIQRIIILEETLEKAVKSFDLDTVALIKSGNFKV